MTLCRINQNVRYTINFGTFDLETINFQLQKLVCNESYVGNIFCIKLEPLYNIIDFGYIVTLWTSYFGCDRTSTLYLEI